MKRFYFLLFVVGLLLSCSNPQPKVYADYSKSSGYDSTATDSVTVSNLEVLGRVWGYAKYHHPIFADSTLNIDYELFELLPKVAHVDKTTRNKLLYKWIDGLGEFKSDKNYYKEYLEQNHVFINNYEWISDKEQLGEELSRLLTKLRYAERESNVYITYDKFPYVIKESPYAPPFANDIGYALLDFFRYWNIIDSYAPNRNITDKQWDKVLTEYLPKMINNSERYYSTFELNAELNDSHAFYNSEYTLFGYNSVPVEARFIDNKLIVMERSSAHTLNKGDEIITVNGKEVLDIISKVKKYTSQSNSASLMECAAQSAFFTDSSLVKIEYISGGKQNSVNIKSMPRGECVTFIKDEVSRSQKAFRMLTDSVGYIHAGIQSINDSDRIMEALKKSKAVIIDLRGYPSEFLLYSFYAKYFFVTPSVYATIKTPKFPLPGFIYLYEQSIGYFDEKNGVLKENTDAYNGEVVLLVDERALSQPEYIAVALQSRSNTITVGSQTAGADGDIVLLPYIGNRYPVFSGIGILYPDGTDTQRTGVRIDIEIRPTIAGIKAGRDELIDKALELIE